MREIKFRVFDHNIKKYINQEKTDRLEKVLRYWETHAHVESPEQYIGLKDKNKKEIYECDIVMLWYEENFFKGYVKGVIRWNVNSANYEIECDSVSIGISGIDLDYAEIEIIGNIHENPELKEC